MNNTNHHYVEVGDVVMFTSKYHNEPMTATVIKVTHFSHCPGANSITVYSQKDSGLYQLDYFYGWEMIHKAKGDEGLDRIRKCQEHYKKYLCRYPVWRERFDKGFEARYLFA